MGEARDFSPRIVRAESLVLVRDESANLASQNHAVHRPVSEPEFAIQPSGQVVAE